MTFLSKSALGTPPSLIFSNDPWEDNAMHEWKIMEEQIALRASTQREKKFKAISDICFALQVLPFPFI